MSNNKISLQQDELQQQQTSTTTATKTTAAGSSESSSSAESNDNSNADGDSDKESEGEEASTSSSSSSDEFYDAEEPTGTLLRYTRKILDNPKDRVDLTTLTKAEVDSGAGSSEFFGGLVTSTTTPESSRYPMKDHVPSASSSNSFVMNSSSLSATSILSRSEMEEEMEEEKRRKRLEEMRRRLNTDEIEETQGDGDGTSPSDSQTSSVEGLYGATSGKTSHPFKVVDHDTISMQSGVSVGRMGRISANNSVPFPSAMNSNNYTFQQQQMASYGHAQQSHQPPSTFTTVNLSPSTSKPQQHQQQSSILQSISHSSNNHNNNHYHNQPLHNHFLHSSSTTASSSSSVSSSEQVPSVSSTATTTIPAVYSATEGNSPISETSSNCSSSIFSVPAGTTIVSDTRSPNNAPEPDLVTSCTASSHGSGAINNNQVSKNESHGSGISAPVAPPRRKRKGLLGKTLSEDGGGGSLQDFPISFSSKEFAAAQPQAQSLPRRPATAKFDSGSGTSSLPSPNPPSPTVSIRSVCRELDKTLADTTSHNKIYVVKAQDEEKTRAKSSGPKVLKRTESLPKDSTAAFDPSGTGSGGYRDSSSGSSTLTSSTATTTNTTSMNPGGEGDSISSPSPNPSAIQEKTLTTTHAPEQSFSFGRSSTGTGRSNSAPKSGSNQLASIISAMAIEGEKRDLELEKEKAQFNLMIRTRTDSGKLLSDLEILEQVQVLNLDTGERVPLSIAEDKIPQCINPLSLHIMRLTSEYVGGENGPKDRDSDEESLDSKKSSAASQEDGESSVRKKTAQVKRFLGSTVRKTVDKAKSLAQRKHPKEDVEISTNEGVQLGSGMDSLVKMKASHSHKGPYDFDQLQQVQDLFGEHCGPVWCMKFSNCGRLLATAGQDKIIRIWVLKDHLPYFQDMRTKNTSDKVSPTPSQESIVSQHSHHSAEEMLQACEMSDPRSPFVPRPLCVYSGHTADLLDIAWSKSFFLLSSSMDRTVRLWHISRRECLCCFQHIDFVTAIAFHPRDDRYFLSGSLDGKLRLWNIPDKKVALWNEVNGPNNLITAANFCQNGKFAVVGTYDGRCIFYHTEQLKYHTQIIVHKRKRLAGRKITGIEPMPGEDKILVTSNDSRIRMYDLRDLSLTCKYKGFTNSSSQIKGTFSHDGKYVVSGSENQCVYIWKTNHDYSKFSSARKDRNGYWEGVKAHNAVVTCAVFAPDPDLIVKQIDKRDEKATEDDKNQRAGMVKSPSLTKTKNQPYHQQSQSHSSSCPAGYVLVSADFSGCIKVFFSRVKPKHSSLPASALV